MRTEYISCEHGGHVPGGMRDCDVWVCRCGNRPDLEGFNGCDRNGAPLDEPSDYLQCDRCGRIISKPNGEVVKGPAAPPAS